MPLPLGGLVKLVQDERHAKLNQDDQLDASHVVAPARVNSLAGQNGPDRSRRLVGPSYLPRFWARRFASSRRLVVLAGASSGAGGGSAGGGAGRSDGVAVDSSSASGSVTGRSGRNRSGLGSNAGAV